MSNIIESTGLTKKFGSKVAVQDLNLQVPTGTIYAFLGSNGAGKTTTIKTFMNLLSPDSGTVKILGIDSRQLGPKEFQQIGYVSENQEVMNWMTIAEFLNYLKPMYPTWDDAFCRDLSRQFDLPLKEKLKNVSRGIRMKASLVSSLSYRPKLLIFDEPFSGLDALVRQEFIDGVLRLTENENWSVFISTHDLDEVERIADWVGIIDQGGLKVNESIESLQNRFRKIHVTLGQTEQSSGVHPKEWILCQQKERHVEFIDTHYRERESTNRVRSFYRSCEDVEVLSMNLREIFLALTKEYKIHNFNNPESTI